MLVIFRWTWRRAKWVNHSKKIRTRKNTTDIILGIYIFFLVVSLDHTHTQVKTSNFAITEKGFCVFKHLINKQKSWVKWEWVELNWRDRRKKVKENVRDTKSNYTKKTSNNKTQIHSISLFSFNFNRAGIWKKRRMKEIRITKNLYTYTTIH